MGNALKNKIIGVHSQLTGERAEAKVRDALLDADFFCSKYEHDRGEDLLVEPDGYIGQVNINSGPKIGLLQIKGHEAVGSASDENVAKRRLDLNHMRRWAAIPLPVFVVAVELVGNLPLFFACSVDKLVEDVAPEGLAILEQKSITISLPRIENLPSFLKIEITEFYSLCTFQFSGLSDEVIARNHYEIISANTRSVPTKAKVWQKNIRILWKGSWRPAHFWAMLNHIANQLQEKEGGQHVPLMATLHVYRSLKDDRDNNSIAHVSWLEDGHKKTEELRKLINWPKAAHWSRFRFHGKAAFKEVLPKSPVSEEDDGVFITTAEKVWNELDSIYLEVITSLTSDLKLPDNQLIQLEESLYKLNKSVIDKLCRPSPQFSVLDRMIDQYSSTLSEVFIWLKGKKDVPELRRKRWLSQDLKMAEGCYRAYYPLVKLLCDQ